MIMQYALEGIVDVLYDSKKESCGKLEFWSKEDVDEELLELEDSDRNAREYKLVPDGLIFFRTLCALHVQKEQAWLTPSAGQGGWGSSRRTTA